MDIQALLQTICNVYYGSSQTYSALLQARKLLENKDLDILKFAQDNITLSLKNSHNRRLFEFISNFSEKYSPLDYHSNQFHFFLEYFSKFSNPQFFKKSQEMQMLGCVLSLEIHDEKIIPIQDIQTELTYKDGHYYINTKQEYPKYSTNINDKYTHAIIFAKVKDNQQNESLIQPVIVKLKGLKGINIQNQNNNPYRSIITLDNIIIKPENIKYPEQDELNINDVVQENHKQFSEIFDNVINSLLGEPNGIQQHQNSFQQNPKL
ncbi:hypothetical protein PPERSA_06570 [Pseudocohnilembus persalinus]|uniref:Uncharacterized protein n=1 Tax=Pseudocohnilembus persalinus TaxID=266149 RepID=A0A0V0QSM4_PSEPJ|nr:hypothetical protein PPERSA_06570 [Pseudocohnilembus persalinus]|eukprot:KRX04936.1 hypothetical protein PPERSA_06570 [Pseudocohnilembus persalinus]